MLNADLAQFLSGAGPFNTITSVPSEGGTMWILTTSDGRRIADIRSEFDARRIVHTLGMTQLRGPFSWDAVDRQGRSFVVEIRRR
jgi:hypothetical protein